MTYRYPDEIVIRTSDLEVYNNLVQYFQTDVQVINVGTKKFVPVSYGRDSREKYASFVFRELIPVKPWSGGAIKDRG